METVSQGLPKTEADYDAELDRLVDTRGISYADARLELGSPPYEMYEVKPIAKPIGVIAAKSTTRYPRPRRSGHGPQFGEEEGVGYPNGLPPYLQPYVPLSEEQRERNLRNIAAIRQELEEHREDVSLDNENSDS